MEQKISKEQLEQVLKNQLLRDRNIMVTYLLASCIVIECMDELGATKTPYKWIEHEAKAAFNHFDKTFKQKNKKHIENLFAVTDKEDNTEAGEVFISTQEGVRFFIENLGKVIANIPVHFYPELLDKIMKIEFTPVEQVSEFKTIIKDEGEE